MRLRIESKTADPSTIMVTDVKTGVELEVTAITLDRIEMGKLIGGTVEMTVRGGFSLVAEVDAKRTRMCDECGHEHACPAPCRSCGERLAPDRGSRNIRYWTEPGHGLCVPCWEAQWEAGGRARWEAEQGAKPNQGPR